jgi:cytochrome c-type biogenesis protein CcmH
MRTLTFALILLSLALPAWTVVHADTLDEETRQVAKQLQCPVCNGSSVADSPSDLAGQMRNVIRQKLEAGESPDAVLAFFVDRYGDSILIEPPRRGIGLAVWLAPVGILAVGSILLGLLLRAWLRPRWSTVPATASHSPSHRNGLTTSHAPATGSSVDRVQAELERFRQES